MSVSLRVWNGKIPFLLIAEKNQKRVSHKDRNEEIWIVLNPVKNGTIRLLFVDKKK